jgi:hypothetical protein
MFAQREIDMCIHNVIAINLIDYKSKNPYIVEPSLNKLRYNMKAAIDMALEEELNKKGESALLSDTITKAANKVVKYFDEKRRMFAVNYGFHATAKTIAQHFLCESDHPNAAFTQTVPACETCAENPFFEPFPPATFFVRMVEGIIFQLDDPFCDAPEKRMEAADEGAHFMMHNWLSADPSDRI